LKQMKHNLNFSDNLKANEGQPNFFPKVNGRQPQFSYMMETSHYSKSRVKK
jgi:hypothetical protein